MMTTPRTCPIQRIWIREPRLYHFSPTHSAYDLDRKCNSERGNLGRMGCLPVDPGNESVGFPRSSRGIPSLLCTWGRFR